MIKENDIGPEVWGNSKTSVTELDLLYPELQTHKIKSPLLTQSVDKFCRVIGRALMLWFDTEGKFSSHLVGYKCRCGDSLDGIGTSNHLGGGGGGVVPRKECRCVFVLLLWMSPHRTSLETVSTRRRGLFLTVSHCFTYVCLCSVSQVSRVGRSNRRLLLQEKDIYSLIVRLSMFHSVTTMLFSLL